MIQSFLEWLTRLGPRLHTAFIEGDRWQLYLQGLVVTLELTVLALVLGVAIGLVVAVIRSAHDQQRPGRHNPLLGFANVLLNIYTTVIRGTPMMVQVLIWCFVIFTSSRNKIMVGASSSPPAGTRSWWAPSAWASTPGPTWRRSSGAA